MYNWRRLTPAQRELVLNHRKLNQRPWHTPPHEDRGEKNYHLSAACYLHKHFIGTDPQRMYQFQEKFLETVESCCERIHAWCILPNHYHLLVKANRILQLMDEIGRFHGRTSYQWNGEDKTRGRKCWYNCVDRAIRNERHFWATINYVHHNPVHHRYVQNWLNWPFGNAREYLESIGRNEAEHIWREYPLLDYGEGWDDPDL